MGRKFKPSENDKHKVGWHHFQAPYGSFVIHGFAYGNFIDAHRRVYRDDPVWRDGSVTYCGIAHGQKVRSKGSKEHYKSGLVFTCEEVANGP